MRISSFQAGRWHVRFLGSALRTGDHPQSSHFSTAIEVSNGREIIFVGAGAGLGMAEDRLMPELRHADFPVTILFPSLEYSMLEGLMSARFLFCVTNPSRVHLFAPHCQVRSAYERLRHVFDFWGLAGCRRVSSIRHSMVRQAGFGISPLEVEKMQIRRLFTQRDTVVRYCPLRSRKDCKYSGNALAFRIGDVVIAPAGVLLPDPEDQLPHPAFVRLCKGARHLIVGCLEDDGRESDAVCSSNSPKDIARAYRAVPDIMTLYLMHRGLNDDELLCTTVERSYTCAHRSAIKKSGLCIAHLAVDTFSDSRILR